MLIGTLSNLLLSSASASNPESIVSSQECVNTNFLYLNQLVITKKGSGTSSTGQVLPVIQYYLRWPRALRVNPFGT